MEEKNILYAGFWRRMIAYLIDKFFLFTIVIGFSLLCMHGFSEISDKWVAFFGFLIFFNIFPVAWLYFACCESSKWQATLGKRLVNIKVIDKEGQRITFLRATARFFSKIISQLFACIGFLMIGFRSKKEGIHDLLAKTFVVKNVQ